MTEHLNPCCCGSTDLKQLAPYGVESVQCQRCQVSLRKTDWNRVMRHHSHNPKTLTQSQIRQTPGLPVDTVIESLGPGDTITSPGGEVMPVIGPVVDDRIPVECEWGEATIHATDIMHINGKPVSEVASTDMGSTNACSAMTVAQRLACAENMLEGLDYQVVPSGPTEAGSMSTIYNEKNLYKPYKPKKEQ